MPSTSPSHPSQSELQPSFSSFVTSSVADFVLGVVALAAGSMSAVASRRVVIKAPTRELVSVVPVGESTSVLEEQHLPSSRMTRRDC